MAPAATAVPTECSQKPRSSMRRSSSAVVQTRLRATVVPRIVSAWPTEAIVPESP